MNIIERKCSRCITSKGITEFSKNKGENGGYGYICKKCRNTEFKEWKENNPEKLVERKIKAEENRKRIIENKKILIEEINCKKCKIVKSKNEFSKRADTNTGYETICKSCKSNYQKEYRLKNPEVVKQIDKKWYLKYSEKRKEKESTIETKIIRKKAYLKRQFNLEYEEYKNLLKEQKEVCAICLQTDSKKALSVDHNHNTGEVRGLLCSNCNLGIGNFKDDIELLKRTILYLTKSNNMTLENRKNIVQEVIERTLPKFEKHSDFEQELEALIKKYPLDTEVNFEPATFIVEETN